MKPVRRHQLARRDLYLIFYVEQNDYVDVWRVLHAKRDIPAWMQKGRIDRRTRFLGTISSTA